jgi:hypothetical protein
MILLSSLDYRYEPQVFKGPWLGERQHYRTKLSVSKLFVLMVLNSF